MTNKEVEYVAFCKEVIAFGDEPMPFEHWLVREQMKEKRHKKQGDDR